MLEINRVEVAFWIVFFGNISFDIIWRKLKYILFYFIIVSFNEWYDVMSYTFPDSKVHGAHVGPTGLL